MLRGLPSLEWLSSRCPESLREALEMFYNSNREATGLQFRLKSTSSGVPCNSDRETLIPLDMGFEWHGRAQKRNFISAMMTRMDWRHTNQAQPFVSPFKLLATLSWEIICAWQLAGKGFSRPSWAAGRASSWGQAVSRGRLGVPQRNGSRPPSVVRVGGGGRGIPGRSARTLG